MARPARSDEANLAERQGHQAATTRGHAGGRTSVEGTYSNRRDRRDSREHRRSDSRERPQAFTGDSELHPFGEPCVMGGDPAGRYSSSTGATLRRRPRSSSYDRRDSGRRIFIIAQQFRTTGATPGGARAAVRLYLVIWTGVTPGRRRRAPSPSLSPSPRASHRHRRP